MKCSECGHYKDPSSLIPHNCYLEMLESGELPPPIPEAAQFADYPDAFDLVGIPRKIGKKYLINTRVEVKERTCGFCSEHCNNDWCVTKDDK